MFSMTISTMSERSNEISGLMIMTVVGGAIIPSIMGVVNNAMGTSASFAVLLICAL